jgi:hypothetical protein
MEEAPAFAREPMPLPKLSLLIQETAHDTGDELLAMVCGVTYLSLRRKKCPM